jgi:hypothetical protein
LDDIDKEGKCKSFKSAALEFSSYPTADINVEITADINVENCYNDSEFRLPFKSK